MQAMRKVEAKNSLENYAYQLRNSIRDEKVSICHPSVSVTAHVNMQGSSLRGPQKGLHRTAVCH